MTNAGGQFVLSENRAPRAAGPRRILSARTANNVRGSIEERVLKAIESLLCRAILTPARHRRDSYGEPERDA